jgi:hypothetical protein
LAFIVVTFSDGWDAGRVCDYCRLENDTLSAESFKNESPQPLDNACSAAKLRENEKRRLTNRVKGQNVMVPGYQAATSFA